MINKFDQNGKPLHLNQIRRGTNKTTGNNFNLITHKVQNNNKTLGITASNKIKFNYQINPLIFINIILIELCKIKTLSMMFK